jgi:hypothetical protein
VLQPRPIVVPVSEPKDVLEQEPSWSGIIEDPKVVLEQTCLRIETAALVLQPVPRLREGSTRWSTYEQFGLSRPESSAIEQFPRGHLSDISLQYCGLGKVRTERRARVGVVLEANLY